LLTVLCLAAVIPAGVGVVEAVLYYTGQADLVHSFYGNAASVTTQQFAQIEIGGAVLMRVPSTFSFVGQYYVFLTAMVAVGYAWWRSATPGTAKRALRLSIWILIVIADLTSGMRGGFVFMPLMLIGILSLDGRFSLGTLGSVVAVGCAALLVLGVMGTSIGALGENLAENASRQYHIVIVGGAEQASKHPLTGIGTGSDTDAARYVGTSHLSNVGGWQESYWVKSVIELGIGGLVLVLLLYLTILIRGFRLHQHLRDPRLRTMSACILGLLIWTTCYSTKVGWQDFDPLDVYLWLFTGILFKLSVLDRQQADANESGALASRGLNGQLVAEPPGERVNGAPAPAREREHVVL
jgi:hypothetical protein